jgi:hypothetical protein
MKKVKHKQVDQKTYLTNLLETFTKLQIAAKDKVEKCKDLMQRDSSKKWDDKKKKKVQERLKQATLEYGQSFEIIDQIKIELSRL